VCTAVQEHIMLVLQARPDLTAVTNKYSMNGRQSGLATHLGPKCFNLLTPLCLSCLQHRPVRPLIAVKLVAWARAHSPALVVNQGTAAPSRVLLVFHWSVVIPSARQMAVGLEHLHVWSATSLGIVAPMKHVLPIAVNQVS
jgi:hypothetical protein